MSNPDADPPIERLIADDFQQPPLLSGGDFVERLSKAFQDHNGRWPKYVTACYAQARQWEYDLLQARQRMALDEREPRVLRIMNVQVIERPGPVTLIWSEQL